MPSDLTYRPPSGGGGLPAGAADAVPGGVTFSSPDAGTLRVPGPPGPTAPRRVAEFAAERTAAGTLFSHRRHAADRTEWELDLDGLTPAKFAALEAFFRAVGVGNEFTYTHTDGRSYTARFASPEVRRRRSGGANAAAVVIDVDGSVN